MPEIKRQRELTELCEREGCKVVHFEVTRACHIKMRLRNGEGVEKTFFSPVSPSDHRGILNLRSDIRRFSRQR